ncbi:hypothetical protein PMIN06_002612 [Paraphaeosphaeria minitans]
MDTVFDVALRATQIVFAFVVLGLSTHLTATALQGSVPFILVWATMVGAATLMTSILGAASNWYERLEGKPMLLIDGCMVAANLAGGTVSLISAKRSSDYHVHMLTWRTAPRYRCERRGMQFSGHC